MPQSSNNVNLFIDDTFFGIKQTCNVQNDIVLTSGLSFSKKKFNLTRSETHIYVVYHLGVLT